MSSKNKKSASIDVDNVLKSGEAYNTSKKWFIPGNVASLIFVNNLQLIKEIYSDYEGWINEINALKIGNAMYWVQEDKLNQIKLIIQ